MQDYEKRWARVIRICRRALERKQLAASTAKSSSREHCEEVKKK